VSPRLPLSSLGLSVALMLALRFCTNSRFSLASKIMFVPGIAIR
jgi:hypothetical protein